MAWARRRQPPAERQQGARAKRSGGAWVSSRGSRQNGVGYIVPQGRLRWVWRWRRGAARQRGRGTPRPYPAAFCVFCGLSVSSVVSPPCPKKRKGVVGANGRSPLPERQRVAARQRGRGTPRPYPAAFCVFCGFLAPRPKAAEASRGRGTARQRGRGTPRPYPAAFCVFCGPSVSSVVSPPYPKNARAFVGANGRSPLPERQRVAARQRGRGTPRPYPAAFCVFGGLSVSSVFPPRRAQTPRGLCRGTARQKRARHASPLPDDLLCFRWPFCVFCGFLAPRPKFAGAL